MSAMNPKSEEETTENEFSEAEASHVTYRVCINLIGEKISQNQYSRKIA